MSLLKPAIVALLATGLVSASLAASHHDLIYKHKSTYNKSYTTACKSPVSAAAMGNSYHAMNANCWHKRYSIYGDVSAGYNTAESYDWDGVKGKDAGLFLASARIGIDATATSNIIGHITLGMHDNFIKLNSFKKTAAGLSATIHRDEYGSPEVLGDEAAQMVNIEEAYFVYQDASMYVKAGQFNLPVAPANEQNKPFFKTFTYSITQANSPTLQVGFANKAGFDGGLFIYNGFQNSTAAKGKLAYGAVGNFAGATSQLGYHVHGAAISDSRLGLAQGANLNAEDSSFAAAAWNTDDNLLSNINTDNINTENLPSSKDSALYNIDLQVSMPVMQHNKVTGGIAYTAVADFSTSTSKYELGLMRFQLGYAGHMQKMPFGVDANYETFSNKSSNVLNVKHSMSLCGHMSFSKYMQVQLQYVQDKATTGYNSGKKGKYWVLGGKLSI